MQNLRAFILFIFPIFGIAQSVDLESFRKPPSFKLTGGLSANTVFYKSNLQNNREPFTYFIQGNLNLSLYEFSVPISYNYSNQGNELGFQLPFNLNRLSLHPRYKWATAHIGDVSMTFSPYTLNGHQFTGGGVDLAPNKGFSFSAMYGRFLKPTEADGNPQTVPSYKRIGYGFKSLFEKKKFSVGAIVFYAVDRENSVAFNPDEEGVLPKENLVFGLEGEVALTKDLQLRAEYATTAITQDTRAQQTDEGSSGLLGGIFNNRASTEYHNAYKLGLQYRFQKASLGVDYERIDPGYETLGAYFFNSDFENITVNLARPFFDNKLNLSFNVGYQRDDLDDQKTNPTNRFVGTVNASLNASERLSVTGSYSNFSTFTNVRPNQFDNINDDNLLDNTLDTLNYRQVSQNANLNINYVLSNQKSRSQNINLNYNVSDIANEQGGVVRIGDASTFHNLSLAYSLGMQEHNLSITPAFNATYNTIGREEATTWGPTLSINKGYFENTLKTILSASYNTTTNNTGKIDIANIRAGVTYVLWERHNFNLNMVQLFRSSATSPKLSEFTATFGYNYSFGGLKKKRKKPREKRARARNDSIRINYRAYRFWGIPSDIAQSILQIIKEPNFGSIPTKKELELNELEERLVATTKEKEGVFRESALNYLRSLETIKDFNEKYDLWIALAYRQLVKDVKASEYRLQKSFNELNGDNNNPNFKKTPEFIEKLNEVNKQQEVNLKMLRRLIGRNITSEAQSSLMRSFKNENSDAVYEWFAANKEQQEIIDFIEYRLASFYSSPTDK